MALGRVRIGLLGLGTVGSSVFRVLERHADDVARKVGARVEVAGILVRDPKKPRDVAPADGLLTTDARRLVDDQSVDLIVEVMGGIEPAGSYVERALRAGKGVVTANKDLLADRGSRLLALAREGGSGLWFEASVGGGIPIMAVIRDSLAGNRVQQVMGIVNGTTNYILSRMAAGAPSLEAALAEARALGYAEADPTADLSGHDAACKMAILARAAFGVPATRGDIPAEGIARVSPRDIECARELGCVIKLVGAAMDVGDAVEARVAPFLVPLGHPLAAVNDALNAICVTGDTVGEVVLSGPGAGGLPTASAVVADIVAAASRVVRGGAMAADGPGLTDKLIRPAWRDGAAFYVRLTAADRPGALAQVTGILAGQGVGVSSVTRTGGTKSSGEWAIVTPPVPEQSLEDALCVIEGLAAVREIANVIRFLPPAGSLENASACQLRGAGAARAL